MNEEYSPKELNDEIIDHLMNPKNYGQIEPANGTGMGYDRKTQEFVIFYLHVKDEKLNNVGFATNGCQDTVILGSMFTEMIKGDTLPNAKRASVLMKEQIKNAPASQQACADMVLTSFDAALLNHVHLTDGKEEAMYKIAIAQSCDTQDKKEENESVPS
ncbi:MAG: iron-sulfur cluster assembly scaffold protein [Campylobacterota bacterium]|nr:iron-sulfur cluster assembly scaffold protein [Campylobacterota bacterium]